MPYYAVRDRNTGEESEMFMGIAAMDAYLEANPHMETFPNGAPIIGDPVRMMGHKMDSRWSEMLRTMKKNNPGSTIRDR